MKHLWAKPFYAWRGEIHSTRYVECVRCHRCAPDKKYRRLKDACPGPAGNENVESAIAHPFTRFELQLWFSDGEGEEGYTWCSYGYHARLLDAFAAAQEVFSSIDYTYKEADIPFEVHIIDRLAHVGNICDWEYAAYSGFKPRAIKYWA